MGDVPTQRVAYRASIWGLQNQKDPLWEELDQIWSKKFITLAQSADSLQLLFNDFHGVKRQDSSALEMIAQPFIPQMEYAKFQYYFEKLREHKFVIFSGVTGSGTSTLTSRLAQFVAVDPSHIMEINCNIELRTDCL